MDKSKGEIPPMNILIGLMIAIVFLVLIISLFGQWQAMQYEQQAEITTKNLQTVMNQVCVTGETQEVSVSFPQKISSSGLASHPLTIAKSIFTGNTGEIANSLRYMSALDSYGDPWYIVYYENFPQGEDSGWQGWSSIAAQRSISTYFTASDIALCVAPAFGDFSRAERRLENMIGSRIKSAVVADDIATSAYVKSRSVGKMIDALKLAWKNSAFKAELTTTLGQDIIRAAKGGYKGSVEKVVQRFTIISDGRAMEGVARHIGVFRKIDDEFLPNSQSDLTALKQLLSRDPVARDKADSVLKQISSLKTDKLTESEYKDALSTLVNDGDLKEIYKASGNLMDYDLPGIKLALKNKGELTEDNAKFLDMIVEKVSDGGKITDEEVRLIESMAGDMSGNFVPTLKNVRAVQSDLDGISSVSDNLLSDSRYPIQYSRDYLSAAQTKRLSIPALMSYARLVGTRGASQGMQNLAYREGRWVATSYGGSFLFNTIAVSPFEQAQYKFYPCSGSSLCMKSAVNPSISIYPLDDCKAVGVNYVELDKTPADAKLGENSGGFAVSTLNNVGSFFTGGRTSSKFYTASPCSGKLQVEKTTCNCALEEVPYVDTSSIDKYDVKCSTEGGEGSLSLKCTLSRNRTYMGEFGELEELDSFTVSKPKTDLFEGGTYTVYFDFGEPSTYGINFGKGGDAWDEQHFGKYYKELYDEYKKLPADELAEPADKGYGFSCSALLTSMEAGQEFDCQPIMLPAVPFYYHKCNDVGEFWLKCTEWKNLGKTTPLAMEGAGGTKKTIEANRWCCLSWSISNGDKDTISSEVLSVPSCEAYPSNLLEEKDDYSDVKVDDNVTDNSLRCALGMDCLKIVSSSSGAIKMAGSEQDGSSAAGTATFTAEMGGSKLSSGLEWHAQPESVCSGGAKDSSEFSITPVGAGDCMIKVQYKEKDSRGSERIVSAIYTQKIEGDAASGEEAETEQLKTPRHDNLGIPEPESYFNLISQRVWFMIKYSHELTLPKYPSEASRVSGQASDSSSAVAQKKELSNNDMNGGEYGKLYWNNLPPVSKTDCLKVKYVIGEGESDETRGFCYTSPTSWADVKSMGYIAAATVVDVVGEVAIDALTAGGGAISTVGSVASCMAGNFVMWYGEQAVTKEKQQSYWPNSLYFRSYFT